ncbi:MAG: ATP-binding protein [Pyrinomonadaceae bacterium]
MPKGKVHNHKLEVVPKLVEQDDLSVDELGDECPLCFGTGVEIVVGKGARACSCRKLKVAAKTNDTFPPRYDKCTFENYNAITSSQKEARHLAFVLATQYPAVDQGLLLMGDVGVGKTHLAVSIVKLLKDNGFKCLFYEFGALLKEIRDSYNPNTLSSELAILAPVLNVEILVLDELGASKPTDWVRDTLYHIINSRYNQNKTTIFTTNFLDTRVDPTMDILEDRVGVSIRSRIHQMCRTIVIKGDDFRETFDQPRRV